MKKLLIFSYFCRKFNQTIKIWLKNSNSSTAVTLGIRTALRHLLQIKVAAVGKIQIFPHITPPASSERQSVPDDGAGLPPAPLRRRPEADSPFPWCA